MTARPAPPLDAEVDLRDFVFMPLDVVRLRDSRFAATVTAEEFMAGLLLWCASWHQVPAGSLPSDDVELAALAGFGRVVREWKKVRNGALYGWKLCSDGRLYHDVIVEKAVEAWQSKMRNAYDRMADRTRKANRAREAQQLEPFKIPPFEDWLSGGRTDFSGGKAAASSGGKPPDSGGIPAENALKGKDRDRDRDRDTQNAGACRPDTGDPRADRDRDVADILAEYPANPHSTAHLWLAERAIGRILDDGLADVATLKANTAAFRAQQDALQRTGTKFCPAPKNFYVHPRGPWQGPFEIPEDPDAARIDPSALSWAEQSKGKT